MCFLRAQEPIVTYQFNDSTLTVVRKHDIVFAIYTKGRWQSEIPRSVRVKDPS